MDLSSFIDELRNRIVNVNTPKDGFPFRLAATASSVEVKNGTG